jgi:hypothetical protein
MLPDKNTKMRNYWATNILVYLACLVVSFQIGRLFIGEFFWFLLSVLFFVLASYEAIMSLIVAEGANAKLANWQETLTDRFALEDFVSSLQDGTPVDNDQVWKRSTEKMVGEIQAHSTSHLISSPISLIGSWSKLFLTTAFSAAMIFAVTVVPAVVAKFYH